MTMNKTELKFAIEQLPAAIRPYAINAVIYDSSCSETAQTLYLEG
jgi:hypothetical protein